MPQRLIPRTPPPYVDRRRPLAVHLRQPTLHPNVPRPGELLGLMGLVWATYDFNQPSNFTTLASSPALKGRNWALWEDALTRRILARGGNPATEIVHAGASVSLMGEAVLDLCSMLDVVFLGHWFSKPMVEAIRDRSTAPHGTRVYFWTDFESLPMEHYYIPQAEEATGQIATGSNMALLSKNGVLNSYGEPLIDKFESNPVDQSPPDHNVACPHIPPHGLPPFAALAGHSYDVDVYRATGNGNPESAQTLSTLGLDPTAPFGWTISTNPWLDAAGHYTYQGFAFDNLLHEPFKGAAVTDYPDGWTAQYRAGWQAFLLAWRNFAGSDARVLTPSQWLWANSHIALDVFTTEHCSQRYLEHFFRTDALQPKLWTEIDTDLGLLANSGMLAVLAFNGTMGQQDSWATTTGGPNPATNGTWGQLVARAKQLGMADRLYVAAWQMIDGAYAFWQEGFRVPR